MLFQRELEKERIIRLNFLAECELPIFMHMLDKGFSYANAISSDAIPISLIINQLSGAYLIHLLKMSDPELLRRIASLNYHQIFILCQNSIWQGIIKSLNNIVYIFQETNKNNIMLPSPEGINLKLQTSRLIRQLYRYIMEKVPKLLYQYGVQNELQTLRNTIDFYAKYYYNLYFYELHKLDTALEILSNNVLDEIETPDNHYKKQIEKGYIINY